MGRGNHATIENVDAAAVPVRSGGLIVPDVAGAQFQHTTRHGDAAAVRRGVMGDAAEPTGDHQLTPHPRAAAGHRRGVVVDLRAIRERHEGCAAHVQPAAIRSDVGGDMGIV